MRNPVVACRGWRWLALVLALGCEATESDYTLQLVPRVLGGQVPFDGAPEVKLFVRHAGGRSEILYLGQARGGRIDLPQMPALAAGTLLGLLVEEPGGVRDKYNPSRLVAYGQVVLDEDLGVGGEQRVLQVLVPQVGRVGEMKRFDDALLLPGMAMVPGGGVYLFGGARGDDAVEGSAEVLALRDPDGGDWIFEPLPVELPEPLVDASAVTVEVDGAALIFVSGGRAALDGAPTRTALLFDPAAEAFVWGDDPSDPPLPTGRAGHRVLALSDGSVLLAGGDDDGGASWTRVDPKARAFTTSPSPTGALGPAAAPLGADGAMICGGALRGAGVDGAHVPVASCAGVNLLGVGFDVPDLPDAVALHAMAALPGGRVLATGGVLDEIPVGGVVPATDRAWWYDGERWSDLPPMRYARARHTLVPLPRGGVLVVGGADHAGDDGVSGAAVLCAEVFDPASRTFTADTAACTEAGAGGDARWVWLPGEGAFGLQGLDGASGGQHYGMAGFGPDI